MGKKLKSGFKSLKQKERLQKISVAQEIRFDTARNSPPLDSNVRHDHTYAASDEVPITVANQLHPRLHSDICAEEFSDDSWASGRRIVELSVLAKALSGCVKCGLPLQLAHGIDIVTHGLAAIIKIPCYNTKCLHVNNVPTGKRHGRVFDANSKLATAIVHAGIGGRQVNSFLTALNIPQVSNALLTERQKESGTAIEKVAEESMEDSLAEEIRRTQEIHSSNELTVSVDGAWQKRGSGKSFDSLSGHCSMIGTETGKVIDWKVRSKYCKACDEAERKGVEIKPHDCNMNWDGSSKAMEQDMVVEMVEGMFKKGIKVGTIIADDDTTTIARLHKNVDPSIKKMSDRNHVKKNISNNLYALKSKHKTLTPRVIKYILKCINYMLCQNTNNPDGIERGLEAISRHPFGDHSFCDVSWCSHIDDPDKKYNALPFGRPLKDIPLRNSLTDLMNTYKKQKTKLAHLGSTQGNESFNKSVSAKAPKSHFYSGSRSLNSRVAATVAQKNDGQGYVTKVNQKIGLSPGVHTKRLAKLRDSQAKKRRLISATKKAKIRRIQLRNRRIKTNAAKEVLEGVCYSSAVDLQDTQDITEIPPPPVPPDVSLKPATKLVCFDLETTSLEREAHITQIAAVCGDSHWSCFVTPIKSISAKATEVTGLTKQNGKLFLYGRPVDSLPIGTALDGFLNFIGETEVYLYGHNIKSYDCHVLLNALRSTGKMKCFQTKVEGFVDTKLLFRKQSPGLKSYSQVNLLKTLLDCEYDAHDALQDVIHLQKLLTDLKVDVNDPEFASAKFSLSMAIFSLERLNLRDRNLPSLKELVESNALSNGMAETIAASNLNKSSLLLAYSRGQEDGIRELFSQNVGGRPRVTRMSKIVHSVAMYIAEHLIES